MSAPGIGRLRPGGLWGHPDFVKLWAGQTVSLFGSQVTLLALPLTAVLVLRAGALQMGVLQAALFAPFILFGLVAGAWVDRRRRRSLLIGADCGRALLIGSIPVAVWLGLRSIGYVYAVAFLVGVLTLVFDVAYQSYLPSLVERGQIVAANSRLEASRSAAQVAGPGLGGLVVQLATPAAALVGDALSFVVSALTLWAIRHPEPRPEPRPGRAMGREIAEGVRFILRSPLLRSIAACTACLNLSAFAMFAVYVLYLVRDLRLAPATLGLVLSAGGGRRPARRLHERTPGAPRRARPGHRPRRRPDRPGGPPGRGGRWAGGAGGGGPDGLAGDPVLRQHRVGHHHQGAA